MNATVANTSNNSNTIGLVSSYTTTNGQTHELADVWFASTAGNKDVRAISGNSNSSDLVGTASITASTDSSSGTSISSTGSVSGAADLASSINQLTDALNQYSSSGQVGLNSGVGSSPSSIANTTPLTTASTSALLASALSQYNSNGQLLSNGSTASPAGVLMGSNLNNSITGGQNSGLIPANTDSAVQTLPTLAGSNKPV